MKISQLIRELLRVQMEYGDTEVGAVDLSMSDLRVIECVSFDDEYCATPFTVLELGQWRYSHV